MVVVSSGASGASKQREAKRSKALQAKKLQLEMEIETQVDTWFTKFDTDGSMTLEREELRSLLIHLRPDKPADDAALDMLMEQSQMYASTGATGLNFISKEACMKVPPRSSRSYAPGMPRAPRAHAPTRARAYLADGAKIQLLYKGQGGAGCSLRSV